ncbi:MAG: lipopolysaccharide assembly protein LapA domain-containing protein [Acidimicrobiales bacterium]
MSQEEPSGRRYPLSPHQTMAVVLVILSVVFVVENRQEATIRFLVPEITAPLWLALVAAVLLGVGIGALLARQRMR